MVKIYIQYASSINDFLNNLLDSICFSMIWENMILFLFELGRCKGDGSESENRFNGSS